MDRTDEFISLLTAAQPSLMAYIYSLLPDYAAAQDVLQETNLTLWHKADDFRSGTNFLAWACKVAYFHVLSHRRRMRRDQLLFDETVFSYLAERQAERVQEFDDRLEALRVCLGQLPASQRRLLEQRYAPGGSVQSMAKAENKSVGAISQALFRIREALLACIERRLAMGEAA